MTENQLTNEEQYHSFDIVFDASGTYTNHKWIGCGGLPAIGEKQLKSKNRISYILPDILGKDKSLYENQV